MGELPPGHGCSFLPEVAAIVARPASLQGKRCRRRCGGAQLGSSGRLRALLTATAVVAGAGDVGGAGRDGNRTVVGRDSASSQYACLVPSAAAVPHARRDQSLGGCVGRLASGDHCVPHCDPGYSPSTGRLDCWKGSLRPTTYSCLPLIGAAPASSSVGAVDSCIAPAAYTVLHADIHQGNGGCIGRLASGTHCTPRCASGFSPSTGRLDCWNGILTPQTYSCFPLMGGKMSEYRKDLNNSLGYVLSPSENSEQVKKVDVELPDVHVRMRPWHVSSASTTTPAPYRVWTEAPATSTSSTSTITAHPSVSTAAPLVSPASSLVSPDSPQICCEALTAECLACAEHLSVPDFCARRENALVAGCEAPPGLAAALTLSPPSSTAPATTTSAVASTIFALAPAISVSTAAPQVPTLPVPAPAQTPAAVPASASIGPADELSGRPQPLTTPAPAPAVLLTTTPSMSSTASVTTAAAAVAVAAAAATGTGELAGCVAPAGLPHTSAKEVCIEGGSVVPGGLCTARCNAGYEPDVASLTCVNGTFVPHIFECHPTVKPVVAPSGPTGFLGASADYVGLCGSLLLRELKHASPRSLVEIAVQNALAEEFGLTGENCAIVARATRSSGITPQPDCSTFLYEQRRLSLQPDLQAEAEVAKQDDQQLLYSNFVELRAVTYMVTVPEIDAGAVLAKAKPLSADPGRLTLPVRHQLSSQQVKSSVDVMAFGPLVRMPGHAPPPAVDGMAGMATWHERLSSYPWRVVASWTLGAIVLLCVGCAAASSRKEGAEYQHVGDTQRAPCAACMCCGQVICSF
eukprot:TRINITY_DN19108_c0_g2_i3.p1 TRINITY_DN19108_c0_g2~~TRINITY_DN19108_c0_g2_i3.p1  ORF type:complete len:804 (-),score=138.27 TRINITY_DN19108_c0_g2_i3:92-2503(-)